MASNSTGYDCGIYVICVAEELCKNFLASKETPLKDTVTAENIQQKRRELKKLILDLGRTKTWVINAKTIMPIVKILMLTASPKVFWRSLGKADAGLLKLNPRKISQNWNLHPFTKFRYLYEEKHENLLKTMFWEGDLLENVRNMNVHLLGK